MKFKKVLTSILIVFSLQTLVLCGQIIDDCKKYGVTTDGSKSICKECNVGYQASDDKFSCIKCPFGCNKCTNTGICSECEDGTYLNKNQCLFCTKSCKKCIDGICVKCLNDYSLMFPNLVCVKCPQDCSECSSTTVCTKCHKDYLTEERDGGVFCIEDDSLTATEGWIIAIIVTVAVACILSCCCIFFAMFGEATHSTRFHGKTYEDYQEDLMDNRIDVEGGTRSISKKRSLTPTFKKFVEQPLNRVPAQTKPILDSNILIYQNKTAPKPQTTGGFELQKAISQLAVKNS